MNSPAKMRMNWLDGARLAAAFCIIGIHSSSDSVGKAFKNSSEYERIYPAIFRSLSEVASTEFFILVSLFLLSLKLSKQADSFMATMALQARRLLIPFAVWTVFYAFFRLYKGYYQGYEASLLADLSSLTNWVGYFILGDSQFHMHFLPTLFMLLLFHRLYQLAIFYPLLGLIVVPMMYLNIELNSWVWSVVKNPEIRDYTLRFIKVLTYTGYGFFAYSLYGIWKRGIDKERSFTLFGMSLFILGLGVLVKLIYAFKVGHAGEFIVRRDFIFYSHYLFPCMMLFAFMSTQHFQWPNKLSQWSKYSFGMYLMHPAVLDVLEVSLTGHHLSAGQYVLFKYSFTAFTTFALAIAIGRSRYTAWTTGLGPLPFTEEFRNLKSARKSTENEAIPAT